MALVMNEILKETPIVEICKLFKCKRGDIQTMQALAVNYSGMLSAFCERLFWSDYSVLLLRINEKINWCVKEELLDLMQLPSLRPERARALYNEGLTTVEKIAKEATVEAIVRIFAKNDGFMSHRKSNEEDLKLKYDIFYTVAHKIFCEAKMIMVKRKVDPDRTLMSYMQDQKIDTDHQYVLDSDYSSDSEKLNDLSLLSDLDELDDDQLDYQNLILDGDSQDSNEDNISKSNDLDKLLNVNITDESVKISPQQIVERYSQQIQQKGQSSDIDENDLQALFDGSSQMIASPLQQNQKELQIYESPDLDLLCMLTDKPRQVETIASDVKEQPVPQQGQLFLIDQDKLQAKIIKSISDNVSNQFLQNNQNDSEQIQQVLDQIQNVDIEFDIKFNEFVSENRQLRLVKVQAGEFECEIAIVTQNRILIQSKSFKRQYKKSKLILNQWNKLSIVLNKDNELTLSINGRLRIKAQLEENIPSLNDLLRARITLGGHLTTLKKEHQKTNNLFNGFIRNLSLTINKAIMPENQEESKQTEPLNLIQIQDQYTNTDKFVFIHSLYELAKFDPEKFKYHRSTVKLLDRPQRDRKIMICHDIPSGLLEEGYSQGLYPSTTQQQIQQSWYRFNHWHYIDVFIYFGHYTVCLPPPSLIDVAHAHGVKVLSVLIFEWEEGGKEAKIMLDGKISLFKDVEEVLKFSKDAPEGNKFYARKLVEIAKYFGFEGYLMNFECPIDNTDVLLEWLSYLRDELHKEIPGSQVVWYDSVNHDGSLVWQSQLNERNYKFFQATDGFFTDYHWRLEYLQETLDNYHNYMKDTPNLSTYDIYYGNDTFGRGTYGGGQLNIYKAINEIVKFPYSIALFGQCYWYQNLSGCSHSNIFSINEEMFWKGKNIALFADSTGKKYPAGQAITKDRLKEQWNMEEGDAKWRIVQNEQTLQFQTIASYETCVKRLVITVQEILDSQLITNLEDLKSIILIFKVIGSKPDCKDPFRYSIKILNSDNQELYSYDPLLNSQYESQDGFLICKASGAPIYEYVQVAFTPEMITTMNSIEIVLEGRDTEYWAGWYGAEFSDEKIYLEFNKCNDELDNNLLSLFKNREFYFESVCTYFNLGYGQSYYLNGELAFEGNYCNQSEYDLQLVKSVSNTYLSSSNNHFSCSVDTNGEHYQGGSSYHIKGELTGIDDSILIPLQDIKLANFYYDSIYDLKIAFKLDYKSFNDGVIAFMLYFSDGSDEEFQIFTKEIKQQGLIYTDNKWAVYDQRMLSFGEKDLKNISIKIYQTSTRQIDLRIGMISITKTLFMEPNEIQLTLLDKQVQGNISSILDTKRIVDVHLAWELQPKGLDEKYLKHYRVFRNDKFLGTNILGRYYDEKLEVGDKIIYRVEAISLKNEKIAVLDIEDIK